MLTTYRPSTLAEQVLDGAITLEQVPDQLKPSVQHLIELPIYKLACRVLDVRGEDAEERTENRNRNLQRIKPHLQGMVKAEAARVFNIRKQGQ
ncbi:hypothetical protein KLER11_gp38 [Pararheinheimera phage vB_PsoM_KLER1-1]|nr:hypothetical protein KLER11_gp38 [Pararheinheimera phage vB_PsoM_KLER1-1]